MGQMCGGSDGTREWIGTYGGGGGRMGSGFLGHAPTQLPHSPPTPIMQPPTPIADNPATGEAAAGSVGGLGRPTQSAGRAAAGIVRPGRAKSGAFQINQPLRNREASNRLQYIYNIYICIYIYIFKDCFIYT